MEQPKVSIIVPVYKAEKYLKRCLNSLKSQTIGDIEIILVNDGSPDISPKICDDEAKKDSRIKVIHKKNEGAGLARNAGLAQAMGKYIGFVDSDDEASPDMFESLYLAAEKYNADFVMSGVCFVGGNVFKEKNASKKNVYFDKITLFETKEEIKELILGTFGSLPDYSEDSRYGMGVWKNLFRNDVIKNNNLRFLSEREIFSEDTLFILDYLNHTKRAVGLPGVFYKYHRNEASVSKGYEPNRFEKTLILIGEVEKRASENIQKSEYKIYLDRMTQAFIRVLCSQEIMYARSNKTGYTKLKKMLKEICKNERVTASLKDYPWYKLPLKQAVFAFSVKYKLYFLQILLVILRNKEG